MPGQTGAVQFPNQPGQGGELNGLDPSLAQAVEQIAQAAGSPDLANKLGGVLMDAGHSMPGDPSLGGGGGCGASSMGNQEVMELQLEQKWIGWLLGGRGKNITEMEGQTGASIKIDQSTKEQGFSQISLVGSLTSVQHAYSRIESSLSLVAQGTTPGLVVSGGTEAVLAAQQNVITQQSQQQSQQQPQQDYSNPENDLQVEQRWVGWILGARGTVLKEIEANSGAKITIDQTTKEMGYSTIRVRGGFNECGYARQLIQEKLNAASSPQPPQQQQAYPAQGW